MSNTPSSPDEASCLSCGGSRTDSPRPGSHRNDFPYDFPGEQPTAREYMAMIHRTTDGPDPLVQEPKDKLWTTIQLCQRRCHLVHIQQQRCQEYSASGERLYTVSLL